MSKYARPAVHAIYVIAAWVVVFATTDAGRAFVEQHPGIAAAIPVLAAALRAAEQIKANRR